MSDDETLSKIVVGRVAGEDTELAYLGAEDAEIYVTTNGKLDREAYNLAPNDLAAYLHAGIETAHTEAPDDVGEWEGVALTLFVKDEIMSGIPGWRHAPCGFVVAGPISLPPMTCTVCIDRLAAS